MCLKISVHFQVTYYVFQHFVNKFTEHVESKHISNPHTDACQATFLSSMSSEFRALLALLFNFS